VVLPRCQHGHPNVKGPRLRLRDSEERDRLYRRIRPTDLAGGSEFRPVHGCQPISAHCSDIPRAEIRGGYGRCTTPNPTSSEYSCSGSDWQRLEPEDEPCVQTGSQPITLHKKGSNRTEMNCNHAAAKPSKGAASARYWSDARRKNERMQCEGKVEMQRTKAGVCRPLAGVVAHDFNKSSR